MREIERLALEKCHGNIPKAIEYAYRIWGNTDNIRMTKIVSELNKEEKIIAGQVIRNLAIERSGKDKVEKFEKSLVYMKKLNMNEDDILAKSENPYRGQCYLAVFLLFITLFVTIMGGGELAIIFGSLAFAVIFFSIPSFINYINFSKAKKLLLEINEKDE